MKLAHGETAPPSVLVAAAIAVFVFGAVVYGVSEKFELFGRTADNFVPTYNGSVKVAPGLAIVGLSLGYIEDPITEGSPKAITHYLTGKGRLTYYSGNDWVSVTDKTLRIETKDIDTDAVRNALADFYFNTPRYGKGVFTLSGNRQLSAHVPSCCGMFEQHGTVVFFDEMQAGQIGSPARSVYLGFDDRFYATERYQQPIDSYASVVNSVVQWRDQILYGERCQKLITLTYNESGQSVTNTYFVQKSLRTKGMQMYVDLNNPLSSGELYNEGCFPSSNALASETVNTASVFLDFRPNAEIPPRSKKDILVGAYWMPFSIGGGRWYYLWQSDYVISGGTIRYQQRAGTSDFYLGLMNVLGQSEAKKELDEVHVLPRIVPELLADGPYKTSERYSPLILYSNQASVSTLSGTYDAAAIRDLAVRVYNGYSHAPTYYYAYPHSSIRSGSIGMSYYVLSFEDTILPVYVGYSLELKSYALYVASRDVFDYRDVSNPDAEANLELVGSLIPLADSPYNSLNIPSPGGRDYRLSIDAERLNAIDNLDAKMKERVAGLNGLSLGSMIPETHNNYP